MSCKFCTDGANGLRHEPIADNTYLYVEIVDKQIEVSSFYETDEDYIGHPSGECEGFFDIKFCPMCGRKL